MSPKRQESEPEGIDWTKAFGDFPDFTFWYGLSFNDLKEMPRWMLMQYAERLPALLAQQQEMLIQAAVFPNMKRSAQQQTVSRLRRVQQIYKADVPKPKRSRDLSDADVASTAAGFGIGYRVVPPKESNA